MSDIEIPLEVRTDLHGDEYYVGRATKSCVVDLSEATFLIFHPADDEGLATMKVKRGKRKKKPPKQLADEELDQVCIKEIQRAVNKFKGGYVGVGYFLTLWRARSRAFPVGAARRQSILDRLLDQGLVEIYTAPDGKEAIRTTPEANVSHPEA
jgi:hypothetical protein